MKIREQKPHLSHWHILAGAHVPCGALTLGSSSQSRPSLRRTLLWEGAGWGRCAERCVSAPPPSAGWPNTSGWVWDGTQACGPAPAQHTHTHRSISNGLGTNDTIRDHSWLKWKKHYKTKWSVHKHPQIYYLGIPLLSELKLLCATFNKIMYHSLKSLL